jgi:hypothetical protein
VYPGQLKDQHWLNWPEMCPVICDSRDSSVGIALGYGLDDRDSRVRLPAAAGNFSLHHRVQNCTGTHPASYPMGTRGSFPGVKPPGREADHSPPSSAEVKEWVELYLHSPNTPSWCGAQLKHRGLLFILPIKLLKICIEYLSNLRVITRIK